MVRHAFSQVLHAHYSRSPVEVTETRREKSGRPAVAVAYGPRSVPIMQIVEAAADRCELLWLVDQTLGDIADMFPLLRRYGTVIDISGSSSREAAAILAPYKPAGLVSYFDAGLVLLAETAEHLGLPFHSPGTAALLVDKLRQQEALAVAGLETPRWLPLPAEPTAMALARLPDQASAEPPSQWALTARLAAV